MFALLILLSQKHDPSRNESYTLIKMCKYVGIFFWWRVDELLCMIHLSSLFSMDLDYLSLFFFLTCLVGMWHTFFGYASFFFF